MEDRFAVRYIDFRIFTLRDSMNKELYRSRIYQQYVHERDIPLAPETLEGSGRRHYFNKVIREHFPTDQDSTILELGCGHGAFLFSMQNEGYKNITGIDRSPEQVAEAGRLGISVVTHGDLMEYLQLQPDALHDVVVTFDVIEHFTKDELIPLIDNVNRILRPGGRWIIHAPNAEAPFGNRILFGDFTHEIAFTRTSITQLLKCSGFREVICQECAPVAHGFKSLIRSLLWRVIWTGWWLHTVIETGDSSRNCCFTQNFLAVAVK